MVKCLRSVRSERMVQDPRTTYSGELGFVNFSVKTAMHLETIDGHLFNIFRRPLAASLISILFQKQKNTHSREKLVHIIMDMILFPIIYKFMRAS